jgi:hypothetical protein
LILNIDKIVEENKTEEITNFKEKHNISFWYQVYKNQMAIKKQNEGLKITQAKK